MKETFFFNALPLKFLMLGLLLLVIDLERGLPKCDMIFLHGALYDNPKNGCKGDLSSKAVIYHVCVNKLYLFLLQGSIFIFPQSRQPGK